MNVEAQSLRALERDEVNEHKYVGLAHAQRHVTCGDESRAHVGLFHPRRPCGILILLVCLIVNRRIPLYYEGSCYWWDGPPKPLACAYITLTSGASGVLGSAVYQAFRSVKGVEVKGTAHTRPSGDVIAIDLCDEPSVAKLVQDFKPDWVVHCAAERRPDVANVEATWTLNGAVPATLARLSSTKEHSFTLIYISTDYVFDGTAAPYSVDAKPNPVNLYGETKLAGERAVLDDGYQGKPGQRVVLRVPVLYGPAPKNSDSAINTLVDIVNDQSGKQYTMDHYATRYPTNVLDIADFLVRLADAADPPPNLAVSRPKNTQLSLEILDNIGVEVGGRDFAIWWEQYLLSKN
ncbi:NAD dependent epimerase/dehydratase [Rhizoctonia solani AG-1 IA]|uniref:NAD dependent epimerase/dehydratase n=1 Tax=Thanatephorus cucumeris (strain AG1-IA) TaxID=983506 RepID=L8WTP6_THACA|nr:NAD dependent epimerase/dehydratase [Rhizoctonia solani AG-1 IA]